MPITRKVCFWLALVTLLAILFGFEVGRANAQTTTTVSFANANISDPNSNVLDAGFYAQGDTNMREYALNNGPDQQWTYTPTGTIQTNGASKLFLAQNAAGVLVQAAVGDAFLVQPSGTGYTIQDVRTALYVNPAACTSTCTMPMVATPYAWAISGAKVTQTSVSTTTQPQAFTCATPPTFNYATDGTITIVIPPNCMLVQPGGSWGFLQIGGYRIELLGDPSLLLFAAPNSGSNGPVPQGALLGSILPGPGGVAPLPSLTLHNADYRTVAAK